MRRASLGRPSLRGRADVVALALGVVLGLVVISARGALSGTGSEGGDVRRLATFGANVQIPLTHTGEYTWTSGPQQNATGATAFVAETRVKGTAKVTHLLVVPVAGPSGTAIKVSFDVESYDSPARLVILDAHADYSQGSGP